MYNFDFTRINQRPPMRGVIKSQPKDFYVEELMDVSLSGEGEHLYLFLEKEGQNTEYVAKQLAKYFSVKPMDVGFSGLKDRWAVTQQWFSIYVRNRQFDELDLSSIEGVRLTRHDRHAAKLRRGTHQGNAFRIVVRDVSDLSELDAALAQIKEKGFPNYFGEQRFGRDGQNLLRAERWFNGEIKVNRSQRSFYLSAARSYLFNVMLSERIQGGQSIEDNGPLYGDHVEGLAPLSDSEQAFFERFPSLVSGLHKNRMTLARRPYKMQPKDFNWEIKQQVLTLSFELEPGAFATSLLAELFDVTDASNSAP